LDTYHKIYTESLRRAWLCPTNTRLPVCNFRSSLDNLSVD